MTDTKGLARESAGPGGGEPTSIIIRTPNWLGDLMMSTSFITAALRCFPGVPVDLIVPPPLASLPLPHRGRVIPFDRQARSHGAQGILLREGGYSHFFVLPPSFSSAWMAFRSRVPRRIGYGGQLRGWLLRPAHRHRFPPRSAHLGQEYLDLLHPWMDAKREDFPAHLPLPDGWVEAHLPPGLEDVALDAVLAPGAEYGPAKQWPLAHYRAAAAALHEAGHRVTVVGLEKDREAGDVIVKGLRGSLNLCGQTDLRALTAILARARLLISNDSGAMHLGAALGLAQIALFGSTNPVWTGPMNPTAVIFTRNEDCAPCYERSCPLGHRRCLDQLAPGPVIEKALDLLSTHSSRPEPV